MRHGRSLLLFSPRVPSPRLAVPIALALISTLGLARGISAQGGRGPAMTLSTPAFADGTDFPVRFSQAAEGVAPGEGTSPALAWANVPDGTQSFVLHMHDMDVARGGSPVDQLHWLVWNLPAAATGLPEGMPRGAQLPDGSYQTSATGPLYRGPGAPAGGPRHHYVFELFALDARLEVQPMDDAFATRDAVMAAMEGHVLGKAVYMGLFRRPE